MSTSFSSTLEHAGRAELARLAARYPADANEEALFSGHLGLSSHYDQSYKTRNTCLYDYCTQGLVQARNPISDGTATSTNSGMRAFHHTHSGRCDSQLSASGPCSRVSARRATRCRKHRCRGVVGREVMARVRGAYRAVWPRRGSGTGLRRLYVHRLDLARRGRKGWVRWRGRGGVEGAGGKGRELAREQWQWRCGGYIVFVLLLL